MLPVELAVARTSPTIPTAAAGHEPKFDGWRCCATRSTLHSRTGTTIIDRFPEIATAMRDLAAGRGGLVLDGEIVAYRTDALDFAALAASPERRRSHGITVHYMAFDLIQLGDDDLRRRPYHARREALLDLLGDKTELIHPVPMTTSREAALTWMTAEFAAAGVEGVVTKPLDSHYLPGHRSHWTKTRLTATTEAAVLGVTRTALVLGRPTRSGKWRAVGLSQPIPGAVAAELIEVLQCEGDMRPVPAIVQGLPGAAADEMRFQPTAVTTVVEITADHAIEFGRWRHRPRVVRHRADLSPGDLQPL